MSVAPPGFGPPPHPAPPGSRPELPEGASARALWAPWTAWAALLLGFAGAFAGALGLGILAAIGGASLEDPPGWVNLVATVVQDVALIAALSDGSEVAAIEVLPSVADVNPLWRAAAYRRAGQYPPEGMPALLANVDPCDAGAVDEAVRGVDPEIHQ